MTIRLRSLENRERIEILRLMHDPKQDPALRRRLRVIWFAHQGWSAPQMKNMVHFHAATIRKWVRKFNEKGLHGLQIRRGGGAPARISLGQKAEIIRIASRDPQEIGLPFQRWSLPKIRDYLRENNILEDVSTEWIRKILRSAGIVLSRTRVATKPAQAVPPERRRDLVVERKARATVASKKTQTPSASSTTG